MNEGALDFSVGLWIIIYMFNGNICPLELLDVVFEGHEENVLVFLTIVVEALA